MLKVARLCIQKGGAKSGATRVAKKREENACEKKKETKMSGRYAAEQMNVTFGQHAKRIQGHAGRCVKAQETNEVTRWEMKNEDGENFGKCENNSTHKNMLSVKADCRYFLNENILLSL